MPDEQPTPDPSDKHNARERDILYALTDPNDTQPLWSIEDLARETEYPEVSMYVNTLHRAGLVNRTSDGYVFATRSAVRLIQLIGHGII